MGPRLLRAGLERPRRRETYATSETEADSRGQHLPERAHSHETGQGGGTLRVEGRLLRKRSTERRLRYHSGGAWDDWAFSDLRGRDGVLQTGLGSVRAGHRDVRRRKERVQARRDLHQVLPGRVPRAERDLGRAPGAARNT